MKKRGRLLVIRLLLLVPVTLLASSCAPLTAAQIAEAKGNPLAEAATSFAQWYFDEVISPILRAVIPPL